MNKTNSQTLIAYYSRSGNTGIAAKIIHELAGGDMFRIDTVKSYPSDYYETTDMAKEELRQNARPSIVNPPADISKYSTVYLGFPNWWSTMPMAVWTFLEMYDWSGKTIVPFCTHGGGGPGHCEKDIASLCPGARVHHALSIQATNVKAAQPEIENWIAQAKK
jgi:flavodoxin